jgi:hypothetical protein
LLLVYVAGPIAEVLGCRTGAVRSYAGRAIAGLAQPKSHRRPRRAGLRGRRRRLVETVLADMLSTACPSHPFRPRRFGDEETAVAVQQM